MSMFDWLLGALMGLMDLNPLLDLIFMPLSWLIMWFS